VFWIPDTAAFRREVARATTPRRVQTRPGEIGRNLTPGFLRHLDVGWKPIRGAPEIPRTASSGTLSSSTFLITSEIL
jgi:hypothetical protein